MGQTRGETSLFPNANVAEHVFVKLDSTEGCCVTAGAGDEAFGVSAAYTHSLQVQVGAVPIGDSLAGKAGGPALTVYGVGATAIPLRIAGATNIGDQLVPDANGYGAVVTTDQVKGALAIARQNGAANNIIAVDVLRYDVSEQFTIPPVADFSADDTSIASGGSVTFTDLSTNTPTSWAWEKNDGGGWADFDGTPTVQNPVETFAEGTWSVRLTATNAGGSDDETKTDYIVAAFSPGSLAGIAPSLDIALQRSSGLLWQDAGKTVPAVADTDPIRVATCPWTGIDYVAASDAQRPLLTSSGGKWGLTFDGTDDSLTADFGSALSQPVTLGFSSNSTTGQYYCDGSAGRIAFGTVIVSGSGDHGIYAGVGFEAAGTTAPTGNAVWLAYANGASSVIRRDGVQVGAGNSGSNGLGQLVHVGRAQSNTGFYGGIIYGFIPATSTSAGDRTNLETYLAALHP